MEGQRGTIFDRNGKPIVNIIAPSVALIPRQIKDKEDRQYLSDADMPFDETLKHGNKHVSVELMKPEGRCISQR